jgi:hypothetical protein
MNIPRHTLKMMLLICFPALGLSLNSDEKSMPFKEK